jgi:hypothetical protein
MHFHYIQIVVRPTTDFQHTHAANTESEVLDRQGTVLFAVTLQDLLDKHRKRCRQSCIFHGMLFPFHVMRGS